MKKLAYKAKPGLYFHGTTNQIANILRDGLLADPPKRNYKYGPETTFGGVYLTKDFHAARNYGYENGKVGVVVVDIQDTNKLLPDEDEFINLHDNPIRDFLDEKRKTALEALIDLYLGKEKINELVTYFTTHLASSINGKPIIVPDPFIKKYFNYWSNLIIIYLQFWAVESNFDIDNVYFNNVLKKLGISENDLLLKLGIYDDDSNAFILDFDQITQALAAKIEISSNNTRSLEDISYNGPNKIVAVFNIIMNNNEGIIYYEYDNVMDEVIKMARLHYITWTYRIKRK